MAKTFFTSDLHFGHANVIRFDNRPFETVEEMDKELVIRWNKKVGKNDTVYILGDFLWGTHKKDAKELISSLKGKKVLIKGNHDGFLLKTDAVELFEDIRDYGDIVVNLAGGKPVRCILSHYYIPLYNGYRWGAVHLHGHSHSTAEAKLEKNIEKYLAENELKTRVFNVGCMYWDYAPVTLDEILNNMG